MRGRAGRAVLFRLAHLDLQEILSTQTILPSRLIISATVATPCALYITCFHRDRAFLEIGRKAQSSGMKTLRNEHLLSSFIRLFGAILTVQFSWLGEGAGPWFIVH